MNLHFKKSSGPKTNMVSPQERAATLRRRIQHGSYSLAMTAIVLAAAVVLNLIVGELPSQYTKIDVSSSKLSVLTDQTKELLAGLSDDITIYYLTSDASMDTNISLLLKRYEGYSGHITVVQKDPILYPKFASQFTSETLTENSLIITCGDQSRIILYEDMYESEFNYTYYSYTTTGFDAEGQITSAIAALSSGELPTLYTLTGHNEISIDSTLASSISKENIRTESLNLISADSVPEDADALLIASPAQDLSDAEAQKVLNYLRRGGSVILLLDYTDADMPNLTSILEYYGLEKADGVVLETNTNYYIQMPYYLLPNINSSDISSGLTDDSGYVLLAAALGLSRLEDARDTLNITEVLTTSDGAYSKTNVETMTTYEKESGDIDGPFALGVTVTEEVALTDELLAETSSVSDDLDLSSVLNALKLADQEEDETAADTETDADISDVEGSTEIGADGSDAEGSTEIDADSSGAEGSTESGETSPETEITTEVTEETETATTRLAVFTSSALMDSSADQMVSGGNFRLLMNTLSWLCGSAVSVSVPVKSMSMDYLTIPAASGSFWSVIVIGVIPGAFLLCGLYIWLKRRKQ